MRPWIVGAALTWGSFLAACGGQLPSTPLPAASPSAPDLMAGEAPDAVASALIPPDVVVTRDELLETRMMGDPDFRAQVERWSEYYKTSGARWMPSYLRNMGWFVEEVDSALAAEGLPASLRYLPIIESGYSPRAVSGAGAVGLWQFMAPTAGDFGMEVGPLLDERRNPFKSTAAAVRYLARLREDFGSWFLALAAYNSGPGRIERILASEAPLAPRTDSTYWAIRRHLPAETRDFVPKLFGAIAVVQNPGAHGFETPESSGFHFEEVVVPDATTLDVVAKAAETTEEEIVRLNPEIVRGITPPRRETLLRVPAGNAGVFDRNYANIPPEERVTVVQHIVRSGETLSHIAQRYGVRVADVQAANPGLRPRFMRVGASVLVPIVPRARD